MASRRNQYTSASDLAGMAVCERQVLLRARMGDRKTSAQAVAAERGDAVHDRIHREGHTPLTSSREVATDKRCFIATAVYGIDAPETVRLRQFRDEVLVKKVPAGNWIVSIYYRISPMVAKLLDHNLAVRSLVKWLLDAVGRSLK